MHIDPNTLLDLYRRLSDESDKTYSMTSIGDLEAIESCTQTMDGTIKEIEALMSNGTPVPTAEQLKEVKTIVARVDDHNNKRVEAIDALRKAVIEEMKGLQAEKSANLTYLAGQSG
jgi:hypothetical protein